MPKNNKKKNPASKKPNSAPVALTRRVGVNPPDIRSSGNAIRIKHREYLKEVVAAYSPPGEPVVESILVNPGLASTFPWLSAIANRYESYTFHKLCFHYMPNCSTATPGSVILSPDYDVSDALPDSLAALQSAPNSVRTSVWSEIRMDCTPYLLQTLVKERFVRSSSTQVTGQDMRLYDAVQVFVATVNMSLATAIGSLWIEYDVSLRTPSVDTSVSLDGSAKYVGDIVSLASPLGDGVPQIYQDTSIDKLITRESPTTLKFHRPGTYLLSSALHGTNLTFQGLDLTVPPESAGKIDVGGGDAEGTVDATQHYSLADRIITVLKPAVVEFAARAGWTALTQTVIRVAAYKSQSW